MVPVPPHVKVWADALLAAAPPLTPEQERLIQRFYASVPDQQAGQAAA